MTTYHVGAVGATVWSADGRLLGSLPAGVVVVPNPSDTAAEPAERIYDGKRVRGYADKVIRPAEDKAI